MPAALSLNLPHALRLALLLGCAALAAAGPAAAQSRGELLYRNHCGECHTRQVHWRDRRLVTDWPSLVQQVVRWQGEARLNWSSDEVEEVSRYLNESIYRLPITGTRASASPPKGSVAVATKP